MTFRILVIALPVAFGLRSANVKDGDKDHTDRFVVVIQHFYF